MSPRQNRVLPTGEIVAISARGTFTGNRGILHDDAGRLGTARWRHPHWIVCALELPGRPARQVMAPGRWTELFFLDEAVALAAGHRPCAYCRRSAWLAFRDAWLNAGLAGRKAPEIDRILHAARVTRARKQITYDADLAVLPDGVFVDHDGSPHLVLGRHLLPYAPVGYGPAKARPEGRATVLTPAPTVATLAGGYRPVLHESTSAQATEM